MYVYIYVYKCVCVYIIKLILCISVSTRTSPKTQRPPQSNRTVRSTNSHSQTSGTFGHLFKNPLLYDQKILPITFSPSRPLKLALPNRAHPRTRPIWIHHLSPCQPRKHLALLHSSQSMVLPRLSSCLILHPLGVT